MQTLCFCKSKSAKGFPLRSKPDKVYNGSNKSEQSVTVEYKHGKVTVRMTITLSSLLLVLLGIILWKNRTLRQEKQKMTALNTKLKKQEELFHALYEQSPVGIAFGLRNNELFHANAKYLQIVGWTEEQMDKMGWEAITHPDDLSKDLELLDELKTGNSQGYTMMKRYIRPDQSWVWVNMTISPVQIQNNDEIAYLCVIEDITDRKKREDEIQYLSNRDMLTGLYNRRFFEQERINIDKEENYPIASIIGDINGLKFINDSFGHAAGDEIIQTVATILQENCRDNYVLARIGGDEFSILIPGSSGEEAENYIKRINLACLEHQNKHSDNLYHASVSLGFALKTTSEEKLDDIMKDAEDSMYRNKLLQSKSLHSSILSSLKSTLFVKSQETEEHAIRLVILSHKLGERLRFTDKQLDELELLSMLHDIGKIGISDTILNKPAPLSEEEWLIMKKHPEIGYRIAMSIPELAPIADYILCHHERWDGAGYPQGLKAQEIPLPARIIAIADAFDAMTSDRPYKLSIPKEAALDELQRNAGKQFDPNLVQLFLYEKIG